MRNLVILFSTLPLLFGCASFNFQKPAPPVINPPAVVVTKTCNPPAELMKTFPNLSKLSGKSMTEQDAITQWAEDTNTYNSLNLNNSALIAWVNKYCK